jgi:GDP/UDP-N,N'-diacetylbacillosamine 2-epimerase (hydrolysing)
MKNIKKPIIYFFTGKRGGFSHFVPILREINFTKKIDYKIIVADMHLSSFFGKTVNEIKNYSKKLILLDKIKTKDTISNRLSVISKTITSLSKVFDKKKPDFLFLLGDRVEVLGAAISGMHYNIPIIHLYGGDITQGGTDESTRHAISKISNIHLTSNFHSYKNVKKMGEESWRVHNVGLSSLDLFKNDYFKSKIYLEKKFKIDLSKPLILLIQHSVTWQVDESKEQILETLKAIDRLKIQTVAIYPCSDPGYKAIINEYKKFKNKKFFKVYKNLEINDFYSLLNYSKLLLGNSSCGILECGFFKKYAINLGIRQEGRVCLNNVYHLPHNSNKIFKKINEIINKPKIKDQVLLYGKGNSAKKIIDIVLNNHDKKNLIKKKFVI